MMRRQVAKRERIIAFSLENFVPATHLLRQIDCFLDLSGLRRHLAPFYSHTGRPSIDPELMMRMLIIGYCYGIRSERRLCEEVHLNLAYRWLCRLGLRDPVLEHSSFSKNRHGKFRESEAFRQLFEIVLSQCIAQGLVADEGFAIDASTIRTDASRCHSTDEQDPDDWQGGNGISRAVREYVAALSTENPGDTPVRKLSLTDPAARWTAAPGGPPSFAYSTNYLVDLSAGIIVDVEATPALRLDEVNSTRLMIERVEQRFHLKPQRLVGNTAYGTASLLGRMVNDRGIAPHVPVWDKFDRVDGTLSRADFTFDPAHNRYLCPAGGYLHTTGRVTGENMILYRASKLDCERCAFKPACCPNTPARKITRSIHEAAREVAR